MALELRLVLLIFFVSSFVLAVGFFSVNGIRRVWQSADVVVSQQIPRSQSARDALRAVMTSYINTSSAVDDLTIADEDESELSEHTDQFVASDRLFTKNIEQLSLNAQSSEEKILISQVVSHYLVFKTMNEELLNFLRDAPDKKKAEIAEKKLRDLERVVASVVADIEKIDESTSKSLSASVENLSLTENSIRTNVLLVSLLSLLVAFVAGAIIVRRVVLMPIITTENESGMIRRINTQLNKSNEKLIRRELELTGTNSQLEELGKKKNDFISLVAHQLRTPLTGIKWTIDMMLQGGLGVLNYDQRSFLKKIGEGNERMIKFVNDLLSVDRIESGRFQYALNPVNIFNVLNEVITDEQYVANNKLVKIISSPDANSQKAMVFADVDKIKMVFQNVLENAIRYSKHGSEVYVSCEVRGKDFILSIKDNGIGISAEDKDKLFNRFYRAPNAIKADSNGTGLGLYLAKNIVEGHGGSIDFVSKIGDTTTFTIKLPTINS